MRIARIGQISVVSFALAVSSLFVSSVALAVDVTADFRTGYGVSDNIARTSTGEIDEEFAFVGTTFNIIEQSPRLNANVRASADYLNYLSDTFEDQVIGGFLGDLSYAFIPERLTWTIRDSYGQRLLDPLAQPSPGNRENVNNFITNLTLRIPLGVRNYFGVIGQYRSIALEESSQFDNERVTGGIQIGRRLSSDTTLSLNAENERTKFDNGGLSSDFDIANAFVRYEVQSARNSITTDVGYTELDSDDGTEGDGFLLRMAWVRTITANTRFTCGAGSRYSDQGDIFTFSQDISTDVGDTIDSVVDDSPFRNNYVFAQYRANSARTQLNLNMQWSEDDFETGTTTTGDREVFAVSAGIRRDLTARLFTNLGLRVSRRDFKDLSQTDDQIDGIATLGFRFTPAFDISLSYLRVDRESNVVTQEFTENRGVLQFNFTPSWGRRTMAGQ